MCAFKNLKGKLIYKLNLFNKRIKNERFFLLIKIFKSLQNNLFILSSKVYIYCFIFSMTWVASLFKSYSN